MRNCPALYPGRTLDPPDTAQAASGTGARPMRDSHPVILGRDAELAVLSAAADAAEAGRGAFVLVEGPAGIGKTTLLRMACARPEVPGPRILTARGLALESGFAYGSARQLIEPVRASAGPGEWDELLDGAAGLAARATCAARSTSHRTRRPGRPCCSSWGSPSRLSAAPPPPPP